MRAQVIDALQHSNYRWRDTASFHCVRPDVYVKLAAYSCAWCYRIRCIMTHNRTLRLQTTSDCWERRDGPRPNFLVRSLHMHSSVTNQTVRHRICNCAFKKDFFYICVCILCSLSCYSVLPQIGKNSCLWTSHVYSKTNPSKNRKYTPWSIKKRATFIFSITLANIDRFS